MTRDERIAIFKRDLDALLQADDAMVIFNLAHDEDTFAQFSHQRAGEPLLCEVSNRSEGWNTHSLDADQVTVLRSLGYEIPSPHHQSNPHKESSGDAAALADEVERIFIQVFRAPAEYEVVSSGVVW
jgi:T3SS (YopN, CesT) and YbjN peptide-binding chaperone 3